MTRMETMFVIELARRAPKLPTEQIMLEELVGRVGAQWQADDAAPSERVAPQTTAAEDAPPATGDAWRGPGGEHYLRCVTEQD